MKSAQTVFDTIVTHLLTQKRKSKLDPDMFESDDNGTGCAYRGVNGLKCAVGVLIEDKFYHTSLENKSFGEQNVAYALHRSGVNTKLRCKTMRVLEQAQFIHDQFPAKYWSEQLKAAASRLKLKFKGKGA